MLEFASDDRSVHRRLYVSVDTLLVEELKEIPMCFDSTDAGVLDLGGTTLPAGRRLPFGLTPTMDGRRGAQLVAMLALPENDPVHFDDYASSRRRWPTSSGDIRAAAWVIESSSWTAAPRVTCEKEKGNHGHRSG